MVRRSAQKNFVVPDRAQVLRSVKPLAKELDAVAETAAKACSFSGDTLVLMADGTKKPISKVAVGDEVLTTDPETGEQGAHRVTHLFEHLDDVIDLEVAGEVVTTTENHPFWNATDRRFEPAAELDRGDDIRSADGRRFTIGGLRAGTKHRAPAYNLSVEGIHTYYVLAGKVPVLVHNTCPSGIKNSISADEVDAINRSFGGLTKYSGSPGNTLISASYYNSFWGKTAVIIRDIAGGHMYNNGNKRTAQAVVERILERNNIVSGPTSAELRSIIDRVAKGQLADVEEIAAALRGF